MELVRSSISIVNGLPCVTVRSAPAIVVSGPAQRLLTLWPARSRSRLATLSIESSDSFVASAIVSIATGWSEPVPGRELHPLKPSAFHGALFRQLMDLPLCFPVASAGYHGPLAVIQICCQICSTCAVSHGHVDHETVGQWDRCGRHS